MGGIDDTGRFGAPLVNAFQGTPFKTIIIVSYITQ